MKFHIYRRPYNLGMGWKFWRVEEAENSVEALKMQEFKDEKVYIDQCNDRLATLGGCTELVALTEKEVEGWSPSSNLPPKS